MYTKNILIGKIDGEILVIQLEVGSNEQNPYISFTHDSYSDEFFTEEQGQQTADEILEDSSYVEDWKMEVANDNTLQGYDDWVENCKDCQNWEDVLVDTKYISYD